MEAMKRYRLAIAAIVLLVMGGLSVWAVRTQSGDSPLAADDTPTLPEIDRDAVTEVEIRRPGDEGPIRLVKDGENWRLAAPLEAPAAKSTMDTLLDKLTELNVKGVASSNPNAHGRLEVDDEKGVRVIARAGGNELIDFRIGAFRSGSTLIRLEGQDQTLMVGGSLKFAFNKPANDFRERAIVTLEPDDVREASFTNENGTFHFRKGDDGWEQVLGDGGRAIERFDAGKVSTSVSSIARLRASGFAAPEVTKEAAGFEDENTPRVVLVAGENEERITLRIGNEVEDGARYVMREGDETLFTVSRFMAERLVPNVEAFQENEPGEGSTSSASSDTGGGGGGEIPPEVMEQIQRQLQQQGLGGN